MTRIASVRLRKIYDSRGRETIEAWVTSASGARGRAGAPSGESTGSHEVRPFPPGGVAEVLNAYASRLSDRLQREEVTDQAAVDRALHEVDGTPDFSRLGGNTATAVSVATALTAANERGRPLWQIEGPPQKAPDRFPAIVGNCLNGGRHAIGGPDIQEFLALASGKRPEDSIRAALQVHRAIGEELHRRFPKAALGRGDEGGWVASVGNTDALGILADACAAARDATQVEVFPGVDLAASELYRDGRYRYREQTMDAQGQLGFVADLVDKYDLRYVEDPFDQEAFSDFAALTKAVGKRTLIVGDDLYATSAQRLERGVQSNASNAVLVKINQVGTVSDARATVDLARKHRIETVTSHRSGDLPEGWLAHFAVAFGSIGMKCGLLGGERVAKLNELLRLGAPA